MKKGKSQPAFPFVIERLSALQPLIKPMFGCHALYVGEKLMLIMRNKPEVHEESNGIWISTEFEHHASLKNEFPSLRRVEVLSEQSRETAWRMLPYDDDNFESDAEKLCDLILKKDPRIGRVPKSKKSKLKTKTT